MGIDSLLSKSTFLRKKAQRIDSVAERIDSLGLCCMSAELLSSKHSNSLLPRPISTISKHFLNLKTYFENLFVETMFIVQNQSYGSPKFAQKHVFPSQKPLLKHPRTLSTILISRPLELSFPKHRLIDESKSVPGRQAQCSHVILARAIEHPSTPHHTRSSRLKEEQARVGTSYRSCKLIGFGYHAQLHARGRNKLRVAANGASIGALDQKLSRSEVADE
ncbi:hypothetical protein PIB30_081251 [Stylosanthes scabra]|uniref:Uncharacterized protein n=1 Tax=Stylosanthes scabra TaxID=79078 RepID=A0ABU6RRJ1_9FABA|nr:hypothetical protein [Stylosanthes scabra]